MKIFFGLLLMVILGFTACEGPMGPPGRDGYSPGFYAQDYAVVSQDWQLYYDENNNPYFEYEFKIPQLTQAVFDEGAVVCYLVREISYGGDPFLIQKPLPDTVYDILDGDILFSETYSYEASIGYITFIAQNSELTDIRPLDRTFHVVLIWK